MFKCTPIYLYVQNSFYVHYNYVDMYTICLNVHNIFICTICLNMLQYICFYVHYNYIYMYTICLNVHQYIYMYNMLKYATIYMFLCTL